MSTHTDVVTVLGAAYVGLVTVVGLAESGYDGRMVEKGRERFAAIEGGRVPIFEMGLQGRSIARSR